MSSFRLVLDELSTQQWDFEWVITKGDETLCAMNLIWPPTSCLDCVGDPAQRGRLGQLLQRMGVIPRGIWQDHRRTLARWVAQVFWARVCTRSGVAWVVHCVQWKMLHVGSTSCMVTLQSRDFIKLSSYRQQNESQRDTKLQVKRWKQKEKRKSLTENKVGGHDEKCFKINRHP